MTKQLQATLAAIMVISAISVPAQVTTPSQSSTSSTTSKTAKHKKAAAKEPKESPTERQIRELREQMQNQQAEIDALKEQNAAKDAALATAQQSAQTAQATAQAATVQAQTANTSIQANTEAVTSLQGTVTDLKNANSGLAQTISDTKKDLSAKIEEPDVLHYKGVTIKPGGFAAAESVYRSRALNSDINTPFSATPYMNAAQAYLSEFNATGRQSRLAVLVDGKTSWGHMGGYYEMDFLSAGTTSNDNQSNSYTLRQREAWAQAGTNSGFTFTGGQMWTLVTEVKSGINPVPNGENLPQVVDPQYHVGFSWARQYGVRFAQQFGTHYAVAAALEESQTVLASTTNAPFNFIFGGQGSTSGLYNSAGGGVVTAGVGAPGPQNYSDNVAPDVIVKATFDQPFGHFEVGGIGRFFRDRYFPTLGFNTAAPTSVPQGTGTNDTVIGGGFFANARVPVTHFLDVGVHVVQGDGVGRYGTSNLGDVTVKPNGTLEPLRSSQGLLSLEAHPTKKLDILGYAGGEYLQRTSYQATITNATTGVVTTYNVGYAPLIKTITTTPGTGGAAPTTAIAYGQTDSACGVEPPPPSNNGISNNTSSCSGTTRDVIEGTIGFTYRIYTNPKYGRIQYQMFYSYLTKGAWTGQNTTEAAGFGSPKATNNMVFTGFRYYIP
jgi:hypothetical protein